MYNLCYCTVARNDFFESSDEIVDRANVSAIVVAVRIVPVIDVRKVNIYKSSC